MSYSLRECYITVLYQLIKTWEKLSFFIKMWVKWVKFVKGPKVEGRCPTSENATTFMIDIQILSYLKIEILKRLQKNDGSSRTCKYSHDRNTNTIVLEIQISKFCKRLESCGKMPHLRFRTGNLLETQQFEIFMEFKRRKKHNNKNEANTSTFLEIVL